MRADPTRGILPDGCTWRGRRRHVFSETPLGPQKGDKMFKLRDSTRHSPSDVERACAATESDDGSSRPPCCGKPVRQDAGLNGLSRRSLLAHGSSVAAASLVGYAAPSAAASASRTFVLVHGAFHGGWCWRSTAQELRRQGHEVYTPTLTGAGDRAHLINKDISLALWEQDVLAMMRQEQLKDVVLVGHSFGGLTVAGLADRARDQFRQLIFLDALLLEDGQAAFDGRPQADVDAAVRLAQQSSGGLGVPPPPLGVFGLKDPAIVQAVTPLMTPHPLSAYRSKFQRTHPLCNGLPATYIVCTDPVFAALEPSRKLAVAAGCRMTELASSHESMFASPAALANLLGSLV